MNLKELHFPVYLLGKEPMQENGVVFYLYRKKELEEDHNIIKVIDDKNLSGTSLAQRRLQIQKAGGTLYNIKYAIFFICDLVKITRGSTWFIDSNGKVFKYKKTKRVKLIFKRIKKVIQHNAGIVVEVEGSVQRHKILYAPNKDHNWAGLLLLPEGEMLYGIFDKQYDTTYRMI